MIRLFNPLVYNEQLSLKSFHFQEPCLLNTYVGLQQIWQATARHKVKLASFWNLSREYLECLRLKLSVFTENLQAGCRKYEAVALIESVNNSVLDRILY